MEHRRPRRALAAALLGVVAAVAAWPSGATAAGTGARLRDDAGLLAPAERAEVERRAAAVANAGAPVLVALRRADEDEDRTVADAAALMTADDVESGPGARDGVVILVSVRPTDTRHGTAAIYVGEALLDGRVPSGEVQRVYADEMAPRLRDGEVAAAVDAGLAAVARDLRDGPPGRSGVQEAASALTRFLLDPAAVVLLVVVVVMAVRRWRRSSIVRVRTEARPASPGDAPPAVAGALWLAHVHPSQARATLLDLARRGAVRMHGGGSSPLRLRCVDSTVVETTWERALWGSLLHSADGGWVDQKQLASVLSRPWETLDALEEEMLRRGLFEPRMAEIRRPLRRGGVAGLALAALSAAAGIAGLEPWGWLGVAAGASAAFVGLAVASRLPEITPAGGAAATDWELYRRVLAAGVEDSTDAVDWDEHLAHAVALCLDREMHDRLLRDIRAGYAPAWADLRDADGGGFERTWVAFDATGGDAGVYGGGGDGGGGGGAGDGGGGAGGGF